MAELVRFGVSLDKDLLDKFDRLIEKKNYTNARKLPRPYPSGISEKGVERRGK